MPMLTCHRELLMISLKIWVAPGVLGIVGVLVVVGRLRGSSSDDSIPAVQEQTEDDDKLSKYRAQILSELEEQ